MPIVAVYVERHLANELFDLLSTLQTWHKGDIILDYNDKIDTEIYELARDGKRPFFKVKQV